MDEVELKEWLASLDYVLNSGTPDRVQYLLQQLQIRAQESGVTLPFTYNTPYINTISKDKQPPFPGNRELERRIKSIVRWNAMAMVVRANKLADGIGGHISTYASSATLYEIGFNHFFRGRTDTSNGDLVYFQGHASPGIYARAFVEGRLSETNLCNFRRELAAGGGLSSYPHPWLMPSFWQFPTVSMGLAPIMGIYQARFNRYLEDRGLKPKDDNKVWVFMGDGESDEPESLGALTMASREKLDNLIFVINCNLQRLDGPVRGNGKIIQELEALFRGAGWNVIKVIWGDDWDSLLEKDTEGLLARRMGEVVDGEYQKYSVSSGAYIREKFFGTDPRLLEMVAHLSDEQLAEMRRGGHDPEKVYAAYKAAVEYKGAPTVVLANTIKGYGLGESGEGKNISHSKKNLMTRNLRNSVPALISPSRTRKWPKHLFTSRRKILRKCSIYVNAAKLWAGLCLCAAQKRQRLKPLRKKSLKNFIKAPKAGLYQRPWLMCASFPNFCGTNPSANLSSPSSPTKPAPLAWKGFSANAGFIPMSASSMSRWTRTA